MSTSMNSSPEPPEFDEEISNAARLILELVEQANQTLVVLNEKISLNEEEEELSPESKINKRSWVRMFACEEHRTKHTKCSPECKNRKVRPSRTRPYLKKKKSFQPQDMKRKLFLRTFQSFQTKQAC